MSLEYENYDMNEQANAMECGALDSSPHACSDAQAADLGASASSAPLRGPGPAPDAAAPGDHSPPIAAAAALTACSSSEDTQQEVATTVVPSYSSACDYEPISEAEMATGNSIVYRFILYKNIPSISARSSSGKGYICSAIRRF
jgi:hypothetical protein